MDIKEKSYFKDMSLKKKLSWKMNGLNTNDELKMNISKSIVDLYFKETSSWFIKKKAGQTIINFKRIGHKN